MSNKYSYLEILDLGIKIYGDADEIDGIYLLNGIEYLLSNGTAVIKDGL